LIHILAGFNSLIYQFECKLQISFLIIYALFYESKTTLNFRIEAAFKLEDELDD